MQKYSSFWSSIRSISTSKPLRIAFSDSDDPRIIQALSELAKDANIQPLLIGNSDKISAICQDHVLDPLPKEAIIPSESLSKTDTESLRTKLLSKNPKIEEIEILLKDHMYQGYSLLLQGKIDALIAGSTRPTSDVVKGAIRCIGRRPGTKFVSGHFLIETENRKSSDDTPFLFADCAVVPEPSPRAMASIAIEAGRAFHFFTGKAPKVALLSFSTRGSADHPLVDRIRETLRLVQSQEPSFLVDGELQVDAALDPDAAIRKLAGDSSVAPQANVFIFPNLESGNIGYKLIQRFSQTRIAGPLLWGLNKPVSDLSRGCTKQEIMDTTYSVSKMITELI